MITITINDREIRLEKQVTVLEAARKAGIKIPTFCYHEQLEPYGGCRLCLVEVERMPKLQTACTLLVTDGMVVRTESETISNVRRGILEFLLINHPLDCPYCDKAGECDLQDLVKQYGAHSGRYTERKRKVPTSFEDPILARNMERCILCTRCVRMCDGVQGASAIAVVGRGGHSRIEPFSGGRYNCEYCGNCLTVCPVGAILNRLYLHSYRPWQIDREVETICPYCGVGCSFKIQIRDNAIKRVVPQIGLGINDGLLCSKGYFGYEFISAPERLRAPLIRKNGGLEPATWDEALSLVARRLKEIKGEYGGNAIGGIASTRCTNEENYIFQKFMRVVIGSNHIDSAARLGFAGAQRYIEDILGQGVTANTIRGVKNSDVILVIGGDPTAINPILGLQIRASFRTGGKVIVIGYAKGLKRFSSLEIRPPVYMESDIIERLLCDLFATKGLSGEKPIIEERIQGIAESYKGIKGIGDRGAILAEEIERAKELLEKGQAISIIIGKDIVQRTDGSRSLFAIAALSYLLDARLYLTSERPNDQGVMDMGCLPDMLPGYRPISIGDFRRRFESQWNAPIPEKEGLTLMEIFEAASSGSMKTLYVMGENPAFNLPDSSFIERALSSLDFLVVQDIFLTETAKMADVVLPALGWSEKDGTFTNLERRIQRVRKAVTGTGMEDWRIISEVSKKMGYRIDYSSSEEIMEEISRVSPLYRGIQSEEIDKGDLLWPYKGEPLRGEVRELPVGVESRKERLRKDGVIYLIVDTPLFHSGTMSRRSPALRKICPDAVLKANPMLLKRLDISQGDIVKVTSDRSSIVVKVGIEPDIPEDVVALSNNFEGVEAYRLFGYILDSITKAPGIEGCEVFIERVSHK
ncbi:MAG: NADH-quinone oxidoreductase subunit NuoG [Nitrospirota bacterium]